MVSKPKKSIVAKAEKGLRLILKGHISTVLIYLKQRIYSNRLWFGLNRNMRKEFPHPKAKIDICVRLLKEQDVSSLLSVGGLNKAETTVVEAQLNLIKANFKNCYVAVTSDNTPCFMQWLIGPSENSNVRTHFRNFFPTIKEKEALLEGAFMHPAFRGQKIMPDAMSCIAEKAIEMGADSVITFVAANNIPSLRGCKSCGFSPYILRKEKWVLFRQYISFETITEEVLASYNASTSN